MEEEEGVHKNLGKGPLRTQSGPFVTRELELPSTTIERN